MIIIIYFLLKNSNRFSDYFKQQSTLDSLVDLLFIYVKFTQNEYKQGMHELLACIMYVLHEDYEKLSKIAGSKWEAQYKFMLISAQIQ